MYYNMTIPKNYYIELPPSTPPPTETPTESVATTAHELMDTTPFPGGAEESATTVAAVSSIVLFHCQYIQQAIFSISNKTKHRDGRFQPFLYNRTGT